ncbi:MAG: ATP-binding protein [Nitrososphaeria archaeon]
MGYEGLYQPLIEALFSQFTDLETVSRMVLRTAMHVTGSCNGFVGIIDPISKALEIKVFEDTGKCLIRERTSTFYPDENGRYPSLFGYALNEKTVFYTNDPRTHPASKGVPQGHVPIERFMAAPIILSDRVLGLIALANKEKDYTEEDLEKLKEIGKYFALALEHYWLEQELRNAKTFYEALFEHTPLPILLIEENDIISQVNKGFEELTGYSREEVMGKMMWQQFGHKEYVEKAAAYKQMRLKGEQAPTEYEYKVMDKNGREHDVIVYAQSIPNTKKILAIWVDITEEKKMFEQIKEQQKKLEEYARNLEKMVEEKVKELREKEMLATLGMMAIMVAHDLRNPLQAISNYNFLINETIKYIQLPNGAREKLAKYLQATERDVNYMDKIVKDLQYLGKQEAKLEPVNIKTLVEEALKQVQIPENIKTIVDADDVQAQLDKNLITRTLYNLILNSIQAMPGGGTLTIQAKQKENTIEFHVIDTGVGMTEETKSKIFQPFYTTKSKGMGLGLAIVKHAVTLHRGTIEVESQPNKGTKITIKIPKNIVVRESL